MSRNEFLFNHKECSRLASGWLLLAFLAMGISTLFAFLLVMLRTPFINPGWVDARFFTRALVLHVDFAVIIWFLSFAGVLWSLTSRSRWTQGGWLVLLLAFVGVAMMLVAAFGLQPEAMLSNYIPVLKTPLFLLGLGSFGLSVALLFLFSVGRGKGSVSSFGSHGAGIAVLAALLVLLWNGFSPALDTGSPHYFEELFWGTGHILQFSYMLLMLVAWLQLARLAGIRLPQDRFLRGLFVLALSPLLAVLLIQFQFSPGSDAYRHAYTGLMRYGSWPMALLLGGILLFRFRQRSPDGYAWAGLALVFSILLFVVGLSAGTLIRADTVLVTAHYHGTVGAVTLSFMGLSYYLLPQLGANMAATRLIRVQVRMYGSGMLLLIAGLFWSGLHNVPRKTPGAEHLSHHIAGNGAEIFGMLLMGTGGLIALSATVLFLFIATRSLWPVQQTLFQPHPGRLNQPGC
ncbi:hypothetical protein MNBD_GAMMA24-2091 [hydrothermal vent metagenome]|uniref:Cytochrome oxidase subunit I profile domain-containing protein n=1 Tax=hydrothermal vent metagenome TaxID=652676 RepID=A0A3B1BNE2_9ZZZZ